MRTHHPQRKFMRALYEIVEKSFRYSYHYCWATGFKAVERRFSSIITMKGNYYWCDKNRVSLEIIK